MLLISRLQARVPRGREGYRPFTLVANEDEVHKTNVEMMRVQAFNFRTHQGLVQGVDFMWSVHQLLEHISLTSRCRLTFSFGTPSNRRHVASLCDFSPASTTNTMSKMRFNVDAENDGNDLVANAKA